MLPCFDLVPGRRGPSMLQHWAATVKPVHDKLFGPIQCLMTSPRAEYSHHESLNFTNQGILSTRHSPIQLRVSGSTKWHLLWGAHKLWQNTSCMLSTVNLPWILSWWIVEWLACATSQLIGQADDFIWPAQLQGGEDWVHWCAPVLSLQVALFMTCLDCLGLFRTALN